MIESEADPMRRHGPVRSGWAASIRGWVFYAVLAVSLASSGSQLRGADTGGQVAQFMAFGAGARSLAMGRAFFAVSDDASSVYSNPAGMTQLQRKEVSFMQAGLVEEANLTTFNYVHPTNKGWVWGLNMTQLKSGGFEKISVEKNSAGEITELKEGGDFSDSQTGYVFGFGKRVLDTLAVGMSLKQISRVLDTSNDSFITADAAIITTPLNQNRSYRLAFGLQNIFAIKTGDTDDKLPLLIKVGNSYKGLKDKMTLALDLTQNFTGGVMEWNLGSEYWIWKYIALRAGGEGNPGLRQSAFGLGIKVRSVMLDVAQGLTDLGTSSRMGVSWKFGNSVIAQREDTARRLVQEGIAAYSQGNFLLGLERLNQSLEIDPTNNDVRALSNRLSSVVSTLPSAVGESEVANIIRKAIMDYLKGDVKSAINSLRYAYLEKDPTNEKLLELLNKIEKQSRVKQTERLDQKRHGFSYIDQKLYDALQSIYDAKYDKSIILLQEVLDLDPQNVEAMKRLGSCFYLIEQKDKAKEIWEKVLELDPSDKVIAQYLKQIP